MKAFVACSAGVFVEATLTAVIAFAWEALNTLAFVFSSFAIPSLAHDIQLPTFAASLSDLEVRPLVPPSHFC